jgi:hypothetical protein
MRFCFFVLISVLPFVRYVTNCLPGCSSSNTSPRRSLFRHAVSSPHPLRCSRRWLESPPITAVQPPCSSVDPQVVVSLEQQCDLFVVHLAALRRELVHFFSFCVARFARPGRVQRRTPNARHYQALLVNALTNGLAKRVGGHRVWFLYSLL